MKHLTIINRYFPPNEGITGESAWDLSKYLIERHGVNVRIVHVARSDAGGANKRQAVGRTYSIPALYKGNSSFFKNISAILEGLFLIVYSLFVRKGTVIVMTSPPLLPLFASFFYKIFGVRWILWSMDLFPEGFVANKTYKPTSLFFRVSHYLTYLFPPSKVIALGPNQATFLNKKYQKELDNIVLPCGVIVNQKMEADVPSWYQQDKLIFGYCGNLGTAHNPDFVKKVIDKLEKDKHLFILAVYGHFSQEIKNYCQGNELVKIVDSVDRSQLKYIDIHLVSLIPEWTHIAVPSKALSSVMCGSLLLFNGLAQSDNWMLLKDAALLIDASENLDIEVNRFFDSLTLDLVRVKKHNASQLSMELISNVNTAYESINATL